jgi:hypothetical protein
VPADEGLVPNLAAAILDKETINWTSVESGAALVELAEEMKRGE